MKTALLQLQTSLYNRLSNDSNLLSKVTGVYDAVPKNQSYPYIALGEDTASDWSTKTTIGEEITHTLHIWSRYDGKKEAKEIMNLILESLSQPLSIEGGFFIDFSKVELMEVFDDPDGITRHGVMRLRFRISQ
ncbi:hypothetical protein QFZ28_004366 [Neobacillus niacini]|uniref:DUF3168 domain-containing protein n=1 Tax=Neobacillus niacini TaxID=86668 RepID=UPI00277FABA9|nr:DUF3168 domain-containing protein [Neobacillus niacini]MDQ1003966.1 hypothetical protein [Neobacillus niacini]